MKVKSNVLGKRIHNMKGRVSNPPLRCEQDHQRVERSTSGVKYDREVHKRDSIRLQDYNYAQAGMR